MNTLEFFEGKTCKACNEGFLKIVTKSVKCLNNLHVPVQFPKCDTCGASLVPRISKEIFKENKSKLIKELVIKDADRFILQSEEKPSE